MAIDLRFPNITAPTVEEQILQITTFLYETTEQLNWALNLLDGNQKEKKQTNGSKGSVVADENTPETTFSNIKSLIIKSADIINAYYEELNKRLTGEYVAISDFGTYQEKTSNDITTNSENIKTVYNSLQTIITDLENINNQMIDVSAYIKTGKLAYDENGAPIYGVEVGQKNIVDGEEQFNKFARFTSNNLSFYDPQFSEKEPVAYISNYTLYITNVEILGAISIGRKVKIDTTYGFTISLI